MASVRSIFLQKPSFKWKNHSQYSPQLPPQISFARSHIKIRKNLKKLSVKCCCLFTNDGSAADQRVTKISLGKLEIKQNPIEFMAEAVKNMLKALRKPAVAALVVGLLLMYDPNSALAASGGRMGGSSFSSRSSSSSSSSYSTPSESYSTPSESYSTPSWTYSMRSRSYSTPLWSYSTPSRSDSLMYDSEDYEDPADDADGIMVVAFVAFVFMCFLSMDSQVSVLTASDKTSVLRATDKTLVLTPTDKTRVLRATEKTSVLTATDKTSVLRATEKTSVLTATEKTSVLKLQVGLSGSRRSLQKDLNQIAEIADTSTSEGLHYVLTETVLALPRHPDYCISVYSSVDVKRSMEEGEFFFNQLSIEERGKFDEETLVNFNNIKKQSSIIPRAGGFSNEYIVITILVAAEGELKLPYINNIIDLKKALQKLASIPSRRTVAVEVLWTPQNEDDTLSEQELLEDYPFLRPL